MIPTSQKIAELVAAIRKKAGLWGVMRYPIAIERGTETAAYGVVVPDLPGCFSAGDTLDEAIPVPTDMDALVADHAYAGWILAAVMVDPALLDDKDRADQYHPAAPRIVAPGCAGGRREPVGLYRSSDAGGSGGMMRDVAVSTYVQLQ